MLNVKFETIKMMPIYKDEKGQHYFATGTSALFNSKNEKINEVTIEMPNCRFDQNNDIVLELGKK